jgi:hypothetical protein
MVFLKDSFSSMTNYKTKQQRQDIKQIHKKGEEVKVQVS